MVSPLAWCQRLSGLLFCMQLSAAANSYELTDVWTLEGVFSMPESAVIDTDRDAILVSNVNTYAVDNNGFISKVSMDGASLLLRWVTGLHSPTGMAIHGDTLFVADIDSLVSIDLDTATILSRYPAPDDKPALNDVTISTSGQVYVSGSANSTIYQLVNDELRVWHQDEMQLQLANGLLADGRLLIHGGKYWQVFDQATRLTIDPHIRPDMALERFDGITSDGCGGYLFTLINDSRVYRVTSASESYPISDFAYNGIDLHHHEAMLAIPRVGDSLSLVSINTNNCMPE